MLLQELKEKLTHLNEVVFELPNGTLVPSHFHVTEVGLISKRFIDCGGTMREESVVNFQLWTSDDYDHRLAAEKLLKIISLSENQLGISNLPIEVEYQGETIGKYGLEIKDNHLLLQSKQTDCLAKDNCGVPEGKTKVNISALNVVSNSCCSPDSGCC